jgi:hypothetical protein
MRSNGSAGGPQSVRMSLCARRAVWIVVVASTLGIACEPAKPSVYPGKSVIGDDANDTVAIHAPPVQDVQIGVEGDSYADTDPSALTDYRSTLDPYGTWVDDPNYGTVWVPNADQVGSDFTPYVSAGHWTYDDEDDYVWISDYAWGWAPFHYGRWVWTAGRKWAWVAGRTYAGAWVSWRVGDNEYGYVGWAPKPPNWVWRGGVAVGLGFVPWAPFVFSPRSDILAPVIATHIIGGDRAAAVAVHTRSYFHATPILAGFHPLTLPNTHGPSPATLGIDAGQVMRPSGAEPGLSRARQYARPSTAVPLGAHRAVPHVVRAAPIVMPREQTEPRGGGRRR